MKIAGMRSWVYGLMIATGISIVSAAGFYALLLSRIEEIPYIADGSFYGCSPAPGVVDVRPVDEDHVVGGCFEAEGEILGAEQWCALMVRAAPGAEGSAVPRATAKAMHMPGEDVADLAVAGKNVGEGSVLGGLGRILDGDNGF